MKCICDFCKLREAFICQLMVCMPFWTPVSPSVASTVVGRCWIFNVIKVAATWCFSWIPSMPGPQQRVKCRGSSQSRVNNLLCLKGCECIRWRSSFRSRRCTNESNSCKVRMRHIMQIDVEPVSSLQAKALLGSWSLLKGGGLSAAGKVCRSARIRQTQACQDFIPVALQSKAVPIVLVCPVGPYPKFQQLLGIAFVTVHGRTSDVLLEAAQAAGAMEATKA